MLLSEWSEIFPGDVLGTTVGSEVEKVTEEVGTVMPREVCDSVDVFVVPGLVGTPEVDVKLTEVSEMIAVVSLTS